MSLKKLLVFGFVLALSTALLSVKVMAVPDQDLGNQAYMQNNDDENGNSSENGNSDDAQANQNQFKCEITSSKIDALMARYQNTFEKHTGVYENIAMRVGEVLNQLEDQGYDVEDARRANNQFEGDIEDVQVEFNGFVYQLEQGKSSLCDGDNQEEFKQSMNQARNQLKDVRASLLQLRSQYQDEVKPLLLELREQVRAAEDELTPGDVPVQ